MVGIQDFQFKNLADFLQTCQRTKLGVETRLNRPGETSGELDVHRYVRNTLLPSKDDVPRH